MAYNYRNVILMIDLTIRVSEAFLICEHANSFDSRISISLRIWYASMPIVLIVAYQWSLRIWYASMAWPIVLIVAYGFEIRYFQWSLRIWYATMPLAYDFKIRYFNSHWGFDMRLCSSHMSCLIKSFLILSLYHYIFSSMIYSSWLKANIDTL